MEKRNFNEVALQKKDGVVLIFVASVVFLWLSIDFLSRFTTNYKIEGFDRTFVFYMIEIFILLFITLFKPFHEILQIYFVENEKYISNVEFEKKHLQERVKINPLKEETLDLTDGNCLYAQLNKQEDIQIFIGDIKKEFKFLPYKIIPKGFFLDNYEIEEE